MPIIEVKNVGKQYRKGIDKRYKSLRESLGRISDLWSREDKEAFWALQDISFNVERGESLGIIGRNGAGKSTLLKILARITPPTTGEIIMRGRVASLLEVGTGFHPELTGRENIFFNGSILGMRYQEIKKKFDEIVDFSGVESFIDTPLKHYSSGMQMRLAFSVAAHLDAEILLIDEVLAVGDAEFQKKCIGKMDEVGRTERKTILFVSHDLANVTQLTQKALLLNESKLIENNTTDLIINQYKKLFSHAINENIEKAPRTGNGVVTIKDIVFEDYKFKTINEIYPFSNLKIIVYLENKGLQSIKTLKLDIGINNIFGKRVTWLTSTKTNFLDTAKVIQIKFNVYNIPLIPAEYNFNIYCEVNHQVSDWIKNIGYLKIVADKNNLMENKNPQLHGDVLLTYKVE